MIKTKYSELIIELTLATTLLFLSLCLVSPAQAEKWETLDFTIIQEAPYLGDIEGDSIFGHRGETIRTYQNFARLDIELLNQLEDYLKTVAIRYEKLGFMSPSLPTKYSPILKKTQFVINIWDFDDKGVGEANYATIYTNPFSYALSIDRSRVTDTKDRTQINPTIWAHLAHELFHAVQASYPLFIKNQDLGDWIVEGTAEYMGVEMANKYEVLDLQDMERWGERSYSRPLRVRDSNRETDDRYRKDDGYWSSSLWRYIGEYISNGHSAVGSKLPKISPDYQYLIELFKRTIKYPTNENKELDWLDKGLLNHGKLSGGLDEVYAKFVATFTHYSPDRIVGGDPVLWHYCLYSDDVKCRDKVMSPNKPCFPITLQKGSPDSVSFVLEKVGSRCFEVNLPGANESSIQATQVRFYVEGTDKKQLKSLWIGTKDEQARFESKIGEPPNQNRAPGADFVSWIYNMSTNPQIFTISNIAVKPSDTKAQTVILVASYPNSESTVVAPPSNGGN